jgi:N-methylhydantoinase B
MCICADRHESRPPGLFGGQPGTSARYVMNYGGPDEAVLSSKTGYLPLREGSVVWLQSAGGGGYGDPRERSRDKVLADLKNGYITRETAERVYGQKP